MIDYLEKSRIDLIIEMADAMNSAVVRLSAVHDNDPLLFEIIAASYSMAIKDLDKVAPMFRMLVCELLKTRNGVDDE